MYTLRELSVTSPCTQIMLISTYLEGLAFPFQWVGYLLEDNTQWKSWNFAAHCSQLFVVERFGISTMPNVLAAA